MTDISIRWDSIDATLDQDYEFVNKMFSKIPVEHFFVEEEDVDTWQNKWMKGKKKKTEKQIEKEKKEKIRNKMDKYNPDKHLTVPDILNEKAALSIEAEDVEVDTVPVIASFDGLATRDELKERLYEKINQARKRRRAPTLEEEDQREKKKRRLMSKEEDKKNNRRKSNKAAKTSAKSEATESMDVEESSTAQSNAENITYSTFEFGEKNPITPIKKKKKTPQQLLEEVTATQTKLKELEGTEEGKKLKEEIAWDKMMKRAQGEKVKDDPKRLKKTIKREEHQKKKSKKNWQERESLTKLNIKKQQLKRAANIQKKIDRRKTNRMVGAGVMSNNAAKKAKKQRC
eukprot:TRINITY_DN13071_c0_g1_i1.p1 TRINITY_DN13071_c0_g1~~TRINITY_DN13071_c0_g1_i1.p1  ORF type:complete len:344 (+),score=134.20 TRINITY_DN13071_c0_g1_i1:207-1238(+)